MFVRNFAKAIVVKKLVAIFFFLVVALQSFNMIVVVAGFYANRNYIAQNLCENRNKPMMHCNGKCYLRKKLAQQSKDQAPNPRNQKQEQVVNLFCSDITVQITHFAAPEQGITYPTYHELATAAYHGAIFHPPAA